MSDGKIIAGSPLARALDNFPVSGLSAGFADRVLAAAETRVAPLPDLRRSGGGSGRGGRSWRLGRRIAIATLGFGALATAAAATGVLERFDIPVPTPQTMWASITGKAAPEVAVPSASKPEAAATAPLAPLVIDGPIDTPEELGEAFRRIDEVRQGRSEARRQAIDQRIERVIERRRSAGLPEPTVEEEARLRQRIGEAQAQRQQRADQRVEARRAELERRVENGEALTRDSIVRLLQGDAAAAGGNSEVLRRMRQMSPEQRRQALRSLPPEQRRALIEELRMRRGSSAAPLSDLLPVSPSAAPAQALVPSDEASSPDADPQP